MKEDWLYHRGDVYCADLDPAVGSEQGGIRPVVVIQNDIIISAPVVAFCRPYHSYAAHFQKTVCLRCSHFVLLCLLQELA